jgi:acetyl esterase/lipase
MRFRRSVYLVVLAVVLCGTVADAQDYKYPYRDPYLATATSAILNSDRLKPRSKRDVVQVPGLPGRNRMPSLEGRGFMSVAFYRQDQPALLVFIVAGIGSTPYFGLATYYASLLHQEGSHVAVLPSPMSWNFALSSSRSGAPGYAPEDARDLYEAMQRTLALLRKQGVKITRVHFMGASLGALEGAYLSVIDADEGKIGIDKYPLINPPLDLAHALVKVDEWHALGATFGADRAKALVAKATNLVESHAKDRRDDPAIFALVARDFAGFTREELQFLVAEQLQTTLPQLAYVARILQGHLTRAEAREEARKHRQDAKDVTLANYREEVALPAWRRLAEEPDADLQSFVTRGALARILDRLRGNPRIHIMHNADDFLAEPRAIAALKEALGDQVTLYPYGGHLGNLWYPDNREAMVRFLR